MAPKPPTDIRNEHELGRAVIDIAARLGWQVLDTRFHGRGRGQGSTAMKGWPDLVLFGPLARVVSLELKHGKRKVTGEQEEKLDALRELDHDVYVLHSQTGIETVLLLEWKGAAKAGPLETLLRELLGDPW